MVASEDVRVTREGGMARLTLNRPEVLNVLTRDMVVTMRTWLERWRSDADVGVVVIDGAGERGLSAGADMLELYDDVRESAQRTIASWVDESRLIADVARYPKPVVAVMNGVVMGSLAGIAGHAKYRVVTDDSVIALPEIGIGLIPAVGGTRLLACAPGETGTHLALTGDRMDAADAIYCGVADWWVPRENRKTLLTSFVRAGSVDDVLAHLGVAPLWKSDLCRQRSWIDTCYACDRIEDVVRLLGESASPEARVAASRIAALPPTALKVALRGLREARADADLEKALHREVAALSRLVLGHDVIEGIRALAIARDHSPVWVPDSLDAVSDADVKTYFSPLPLPLPLPSSALRAGAP
jgi:enoyl-CoA hydratase